MNSLFTGKWNKPKQVADRICICKGAVDILGLCPYMNIHWLGRWMVTLSSVMNIKYPFWAIMEENPNTVYACLNYNEAICPEQFRERSICLGGDSGDVLKALRDSKQ